MQINKLIKQLTDRDRNKFEAWSFVAENLFFFFFPFWPFTAITPTYSIFFPISNNAVH